MSSPRRTASSISTQVGVAVAVLQARRRESEPVQRGVDPVGDLDDRVDHLRVQPLPAFGVARVQVDRRRAGGDAGGGVTRSSCGDSGTAGWSASYGRRSGPPAASGEVNDVDPRLARGEGGTGAGG